MKISDRLLEEIEECGLNGFICVNDISKELAKELIKFRKQSDGPIDKLCSALIKDAGYRLTWEANIAMAFKDTFHEQYLHKGVHEIANEAAKRFINILITTGRNND